MQSNAMNCASHSPPSGGVFHGYIVRRVLPSGRSGPRAYLAGWQRPTSRSRESKSSRLVLDVTRQLLRGQAIVGVRGGAEHGGGAVLDTSWRVSARVPSPRGGTLGAAFGHVSGLKRDRITKRRSRGLVLHRGGESSIFRKRKPEVVHLSPGGAAGRLGRHL